MLPDVALLKIFDFYVHERLSSSTEWPTLVHVCLKWRNIVFGSPRRLDLHVRTSMRRPLKETLDVWSPTLRVAIDLHRLRKCDVDDIIAALEQNDRIYELCLFKFSNWELEKIFAAMQRPFPELTRLRLRFDDKTAPPVIPVSFLGGSAPRLQTLQLTNILVSGLPQLLLSATQLVRLYLWEIPCSESISPEVMATSLSVLTRLESLVIEFEFPGCCPDRKTRRPRPPLLARALLPVLTDLQFLGVSEYLEDFVARIDTPLLEDLMITFFHQEIFDTPQLTEFINRAPSFNAYNQALVNFFDWDVSVTLPRPFDGALELGIACRQQDWQLSSLTQLCSSSFPLIPTVEHLYIQIGCSRWYRLENIESSQWFQLFHQFTAVRGLYISWEIVPHVSPALQELVGVRDTEVLPALETLFLEETLPSESVPVQEAIGQFIAARRLAGHPISVSSWQRRKE
jgi:hypothetical protein